MLLRRLQSERFLRIPAPGPYAWALVTFIALPEQIGNGFFRFRNKNEIAFGPGRLRTTILLGTIAVPENLLTSGTVVVFWKGDSVC